MQCLTLSDCPSPGECSTMGCIGGTCVEGFVPGGKLCNGSVDQCDGAGQCVDCFDNGGCEECCVCANNQCIDA